MHPLQQALSPPYRLDGLPVIRDVAYHCQARRLVWPAKGVVYGRDSKPTGTPAADGYVRSAHHPRHQYAHRLVWEVVNGPIPSGMQIDHKNGRKDDNRIANLDLVTQSENVLRALERGQMPCGEARANAKLTEELVCQIRASARPTLQWARDLDIDPKTVRTARRGTSWRHVVCRGAKPIQSRRSRRRTRRDAPEGGAA